MIELLPEVKNALIETWCKTTDNPQNYDELIDCIVSAAKQLNINKNKLEKIKLYILKLDQTKTVLQDVYNKLKRA